MTCNGWYNWYSPDFYWIICWHTYTLSLSSRLEFGFTSGRGTTYMFFSKTIKDSTFTKFSLILLYLAWLIELYHEESWETWIYPFVCLTILQYEILFQFKWCSVSIKWAGVFLHQQYCFNWQRWLLVYLITLARILIFSSMTSKIFSLHSFKTKSNISITLVHGSLETLK